MKQFDKMFNYELQAELVREGDCREAFPVTAIELEWLSQSLRAGSAATFLQPQTMEKLARILAPYESETSDIVEKAAVSNSELMPSASFRILRQALRERSGVLLTVLSHKPQTEPTVQGWPIYLEFNMARREWYLVWMRSADRHVRVTRLRNIASAELIELANQQSLAAAAVQALKRNRLSAVVELNPDYPADRHRVLSALSAFDRDVEMSEGGGLRISVQYNKNEEGYLLQRIRFLGLRVHITAPERLVTRMRETAVRASSLYSRTDSE